MKLLIFTLMVFAAGTGGFKSKYLLVHKNTKKQLWRSKCYSTMVRVKTLTYINHQTNNSMKVVCAFRMLSDNVEMY